MASELKAEDLLPLIAKLPLRERQRLLQLILSQGLSEAQAYAVKLPRCDEFSSDEDGLSWDADDWEGIG
jgi:hypothetical protein